MTCVQYLYKFTSSLIFLTFKPLSVFLDMVYCGVRLKSDKTLDSYNIGNSSSINVIVKDNPSQEKGSSAYVVVY